LVDFPPREKEHEVLPQTLRVDLPEFKEIRKTGFGEPLREGGGLEGLSTNLAFPRVKGEKQLNSCGSEAVVVSCETESCGKKLV
jgi:hypothetical protein